MSGTVMKFGPQWIRTLTDGAAPNPASDNSSSSSNSIYSSTNSASNNVSSAASNNNTNNSKTGSSNSTTTNNNSAGAGKYKLAEYRYGREEMLALYEPGMEAPEDIKRFAELFVEKARMPMAMTQMSEDEVKLSTRGWNSEAVLRSTSGKLTTAGVAGSAAGPVVGGAPGSNHIIGGQPGSGGIGSAINRDSRQLSERGAMTAAEVLSSSPRGPPGSLSRVPPSEQRGLLSSLSSRAHPSSTIRQLVGRQPGLYMRSQSHDDEGIGGDGVSSAGQVSAGAGVTSGIAYENRFGSLNQTRQPSGLRARFEANRTTGGAPVGLSSSAKPIDIKAGVDGESTGKSVFDRLPSKYSTDDKLIRKDINGRPLTQGDWRSREWSAGGIQGAGSIPKGTGLATDERPWRTTRVSGAGAAEDWRSGSNPNANSTSSSWYVKTDERNVRGQAPHNQENLNPSFGGKRDTTRRPSADDKHGDEDDEPIGIQPRHRRDSLPEWSIGDPLSGDKVGSFDASGAFREISRDDSGNTVNKMKETERQLHQHHQQQQMNQSKRQQEHQQKEQQQHQGNDFEHLERAAEIMVEKWTEDEDQHHERRTSPEYLGNKMNQTSAREHHDAQQQANMLQNNVIDSRKSNQTPQRQEQHQSGQQEHSSLGGGAMIASQAFDSTNNPQKFILLPANHEDSQQWFYRDTQGVIQGPFSANDMCEWYKAGYFVKELLVRRACDELFYPLGEVIKMWERVPFAPMPMNLPNPPPITTQTILQFRAMAKQLEMAASQGRMPQNAFDVGHPGAVLLHGPMMQQQQQQIHPVLAAASLNQNAMAPPDQQANIRQIIEAATRQQQQQHDSSLVQQQRNLPVNVPDQNEMQAQLRQLLAQLKNREGFSNLNAQEQQEVLVRQFVASRSMPQNNVATSNGGSLQEQQEQQAMLQQRARMMPFLPAFLSSDQQDRLRYQQELERRHKEEAEKLQQTRLIMEQRMKAEEEKQRLMEEVQKQRQRKQLEENEQKQKQEAEKTRILKLSQLKQQQLAEQHEEFKQQLQNQQRLQQQQQQEKLQQKQQQQQQQQQQTQQQLQQNSQLSTIQQQQQQQIERAKKAAQAQQLQQEQQQRKTAWSTVSKPDQEPVSLATLQKLQEEEKERERERQRQQQQQQQAQSNQQQQQLEKFQRQMTWASAAQQSKAAPIKTLAEIQKEEEERLAREKQRKAKVQPVVASSGVWNNAASHLSWKNPPSD